MNELLRAYSAAQTAIAYVELFFCEAVEGEPGTAWDYVIAAGHSPPQVVEFVRETAEEDLKEGGTAVPADVLRKVVAETQTTDFAKYIGGKMGCA